VKIIVSNCRNIIFATEPHIIKFDLQSRAKDLKGEGKTLEDISKILTKESKSPISLSTVYRYFDSNGKAMVQAVEKSDKLRAKVADAEICTINQRMEVILSLIEIGSEARAEGDRRGAVLALKAATEALHLLDQRLGRLTPNNTLIQINNNPSKLEYMSDAELIEIIKREQELLNQEVDCID
jgi:hypothetical protein